MHFDISLMFVNSPHKIKSKIFLVTTKAICPPKCLSALLPLTFGQLAPPIYGKLAGFKDRKFVRISKE